MEQQPSPTKDPSAQPTSAAWVVVLVGAAALALVFIASSIDLIRVAISSQPECVAHDRVGEDDSPKALAAKSSC